MVRRDAPKKILLLIIIVYVIFLLIFQMSISVICVELNSGSQSPSTLMVGDKICFNNVRLTIRKNERIDVDYIKFSIFDSNNDEVAFVSFDISGKKIAESPVGSFTVINFNDVTKYYSKDGLSYGIDEHTGKYIPNYKSGYGSSTDDLDVLYKITYTTHISGTFYNKLLVNSTLHRFESSTIFIVNPNDIEENELKNRSIPVADVGRFYSGLVNTSITFDGSDSKDFDGIIKNYFWDFGDGTNGTGIITSHKYSKSGDYTLKLYVTDDSGLNATDETTVIIFNEEDLQPPIADPGGPYSVLTYESLKLDGYDSYDPDGNVLTFLWDFGDGQLSLGKEPTHSYDKAGEYIIKLTVIDSDGLSDTKITNATIILDTDADGWSDEIENSYNKNINDPKDTPNDIDNDGIPDDDSPDKKYAGDLDDDNDGIEDVIELSLDSDPKSSFDVENIKIEGEESFMVDTLGDGKFDKFYNPETYTMTDLHYSNGNYLINIDEDPDWEYIYNPAQGTISEYSDELIEKISKKSNWTFPFVIVIIVVSTIILIIVVLFKTGYLYIEEIPIDKLDGKSRNENEPERKEWN